MDVAKEKGVWFVGKDMDIVGEYGWSDTNTVAVSFDTRWEVIYEQMVLDYMAGNKTPETSCIRASDDDDRPTAPGATVTDERRQDRSRHQPGGAPVHPAGDHRSRRAAARADDER
jgi:hypothetical protein